MEPSQTYELWYLLSLSVPDLSVVQKISDSVKVYSP